MRLDPIWRPVTDALDRTADQGHTLDIWLRDDDAVTVTPALVQLTALSRRFDVPVLLAVVPDGADRGLAAHVEAHAALTPAQHGFRHANHAAPGERARELGGQRPVAEVLDELRRGRMRMLDLFGPGAADILVPPWNRIDASLLPALPGLGYRALSTFGPATNLGPSLLALNTDLDIIDWRNGRRCRPLDRLVAKLTELIADRRDKAGPIGLLTHHLVHDDQAWHFLDEAMSCLKSHAAVRFVGAPSVVARLAPHGAGTIQCTDAFRF